MVAVMEIGKLLSLAFVICFLYLSDMAYPGWYVWYMTKANNKPFRRLLCNQTGPTE